MNLLLYPAELLQPSEGQQDTTAITQRLPTVFSVISQVATE